MKYFDIDISSVIVYICFAIFMTVCYFVLPKDIPMGLVLPKNTPIQTDQGLLALASAPQFISPGPPS
jgi:amino acid permease